MLRFFKVTNLKYWIFKKIHKVLMLFSTIFYFLKDFVSYFCVLNKRLEVAITYNQNGFIITWVFNLVHATIYLQRSLKRIQKSLHKIMKEP